MAGVRVIRGPDWKWENQDGGDGHVGTVERCIGGLVGVIWDCGFKNLYRVGAEGAYELTLLDSGPAGVKHPGVKCSACDEKDIRGLRWKCLDCNNYDLYTVCYGNDKHDKNHAFNRIDKPGKDGVTVEKRSSSEKAQSKGIYPGAAVVRGQDWDKGNQDGGDGNTGVVVKTGYVNELNTDKAMCVVVWQNDSNQYIHRLGLGGNADVKYTQPAMGWIYYRKHLPVLRDVSEVCDKGQTTGLSGGIEGALAPMMASGGLLSGGLLSGGLLPHGIEIGVKIRSDKDDEKGATENCDKEASKKFKVGDLVRLCSDLETLTRLQDGHGGFNQDMKEALNTVGVVSGIIRGQMLVQFGSNRWRINPEALTIVTTGTEDNKPPPTFKIGDKLILNKSVSATKDLQTDHGGWNKYLEHLIKTKSAGTLKEIDSDGDIRVDFGSDVVFLLNPAVCEKVRHKDVNADVKTPLDDVGPESSRSDQSPLDAAVSANIDNDGEVPLSNAEGGATSTRCNAEGGATSNAVGGATSNSEVGATNTLTNAEGGATSTPKNEGRFSAGDQVRIDVGEDTMTSLQKGHGGWDPKMKEVMMVNGKVREVLPSGDIKVQYENDIFIINPAALKKL